MGTDIHFYVEHRVNGSWKNIYKREECRYSPNYTSPKYTRNYYGFDGRNYFLFGILAGVRGDATPIDAPRGLPKDVTQYVQKESDRYGTDGHSRSWFSLKELLAYNWAKEYENNDYRDLNALQRLKRRLRQRKKEGDEITYGDMVGDFYDVTLMRLTLLENDPENVRVVFWFDS